MRTSFLILFLIVGLFCACVAIVELEEQLHRLQKKVATQEVILRKIHKQNVTIKNILKKECIFN